MPPPPAFDHLSAELSLWIVQFLPIRESSRLAQASKRCFYLVHQFRAHLGPELVCTEAKKGRSDAMAVYTDALLRMRSPPQLVLLFSGESTFGSHEDDLPFYRSAFPAPRRAVVLGCTSAEPSRAVPCGSDHMGAHAACDIDDYLSVMVVGGMPEATTMIQPFQFLAPYRSEMMEHDKILQQLGAKTDWKTFIIFASSEFPLCAVENLQQHFPEALIVGGFCNAFFTYLTSRNKEKDQKVSRYYKGAKGTAAPPGMTIDEMWESIGPILDTAGATACGVALSGDIPFHAVVSHGLASVTKEHDFVVRQSTVQPFNEPCHSVDEVVNRCPNPGIPISGAQFYKRFKPDAIGIKYPNTDGFTICPYANANENEIDLQICTLDHTSVNGCCIDAFRFTKESMLADVEHTLNCLRLSLGDNKILGAIMISCNCRGPGSNSMLGEEEADAKRFAVTFPGVPCLGWYAGGEIGPRARARQESPSPFRTGDACVQSFTVVFGVFIAPQSKSTTKAPLDDTPSTIVEFVKIRLQASVSH